MPFARYVSGRKCHLKLSAHVVPPYASIEIKRACESDRFAIAAQPHRCREECRREDQSDPQARAAQEFAGSKLRQRNKMRIDGSAIRRLEVESVLSESKQTVFQQRTKIGRVE